MVSETIQASIKCASQKVPQTCLNSKLSSEFEAPVKDHNPRKRPKIMSDYNEIVADILRKSISRGDYPFPEDEIKRALEFKEKDSESLIATNPQEKSLKSGMGGSKEKKDDDNNSASQDTPAGSLVDLTSFDPLVIVHQTESLQVLAASKRNKGSKKKKGNGAKRDAPLDSARPIVDLTGADSFEMIQYDENVEKHKDKIICGLRGSIPDHLFKYWRYRHKLFSRYNEGCLMDEEGWYSVTPELVARHIAKRMACDVIIDAFCGVGGNSIQFAQTCKQVIAIDNNPTRLAFAKHNAKVYGVAHKIDFILGDFFELASSLKANAIFLSPPWGGPAYNTVNTFDIHTMMPFSGVKLFKLCASITPNIGYFLPRNTDYNQLACLANPIGNCEIEEAYSSYKFIAVTAYYGNFVS